MKIAIYSRKSKFTGKGESIANQIEMCKTYIASHFETYELMIYEDEGFSGGTTDRPQFKQLLQDAKQHQFDILICYRLDRISRNIADFSSLIEDLESLHIHFISIKEQFDTSTPMGRAMMYITSVFAQLERETIAERIRDNMLQLAKTGRWLGGNTPTGFESTSCITEDTNGKIKKAFKLSPVPNELQLVTCIFNKYLELKSLSQVETYLLQHHLTTKNGSRFTRFSLRTILSNPVYAKADAKVYEYFLQHHFEVYAPQEAFDGRYGIMAYNKTLQKKHQANQFKEPSEWIIAIGQHEGLIQGADWVKVQTLLQRNKSKSFRKTRNQKALLSGILRCSQCGSYMRPKMGRFLKDGTQMFYYLCELKETSKGMCCNCPNVPGPLADATVIDFLSHTAHEPQLLQTHLAKLLNPLTHLSHPKALPPKSQFFKEMILKNELAIKNLVNSLSLSKETTAYQYIINEINTLDAHNVKLKKELQLLTEQSLETLEQLSCNEDVERFLDSLALVIEKSNDFIKIRELLHDLVEKILWDGKDLDIYLKPL